MRLFRASLPVICLFIAALRLPAFLIPFWNKDEWWNAARAVTTKAGGIFYIDAYDLKTPLLYYIHDWCFRLADGVWQMYVVRGWYLLSIVGVALGVAAIAREISGGRAGRLAALLFGIFSMTWISQETYYAGTENFANLPMTLGALCLLLAARKGRWFDLLAGIFVSLAILTRNSVLPDLALYGVYLGWLGYSDRQWGVMLRRMLAVGLGVALPLLVCWYYLMSVGAWDEAVYWNFDFIKLYLSYSPPWSDVIIKGLTHTGMIVAAMGLLYYFAIRMFAQVVRTRRHDAILFPCLWLVAGIYPVMAGGRFSTHYYFQLLPALSVLAGIYFDSTFTWWDAKRWRRAWLMICCFIPLAGFSTDIVRQIGNYHGWWNGRPNYLEIAAEAAARSAPEDRIVVWGYLPQVYFFANRVPATKFQTVSQLTGQVREDYEYSLDLPEMQKLWADFWDEMRRHKPTLFIDASRSFKVSGRYMHPVEHFPELKQWLDQHYRQITTIHEAVFYERVH